MNRLTLAVFALLLGTPVSAGPYTQQTSFGVPVSLVRAAQTQSTGASSWTALPAMGGTVLQGGTVEAAPFNELIPSWNVSPARNLQAPGGAVKMEVRVRRPDGRWTGYFSFGTWRSSGPRASLAVSRTPDGTLNTDTLTLPYRSTAFQYRLTVEAGASVRLVSFNTSDTALRLQGLGTAGHAAAWNRLLKVPQLSQMIYPGGGEVWCSPTSVSMLLAYWQRPVPVPDAARATFDPVYDGYGNWPFNTAYAATQGMQAYVTRLGSLRDAEAYLVRGLPLAVSVRFRAGELPGSPIPASTGHVMVLIGFDAQGNPVLNDPAARSNAEVQRTYPRAIFERLWLTHSGGMAYVMAPQP